VLPLPHLKREAGRRRRRREKEGEGEGTRARAKRQRPVQVQVQALSATSASRKRKQEASNNDQSGWEISQAKRRNIGSFSSKYCAQRPVFLCVCVGMSHATCKQHIRSKKIAPPNWWSCSATASGSRGAKAGGRWYGFWFLVSVSDYRSLLCPLMGFPRGTGEKMLDSKRRF
jgi:hypothetical protein